METIQADGKFQYPKVRLKASLSQQIPFAFRVSIPEGAIEGRRKKLVSGLRWPIF